MKALKILNTEKFKKKMELWNTVIFVKYQVLKKWGNECSNRISKNNFDKLW